MSIVRAFSIVLRSHPNFTKTISFDFVEVSLKILFSIQSLLHHRSINIITSPPCTLTHWGLFKSFHILSRMLMLWSIWAITNFHILLRMVVLWHDAKLSSTTSGFFRSGFGVEGGHKFINLERKKRRKDTRITNVKLDGLGSPCASVYFFFMGAGEILYCKNHVLIVQRVVLDIFCKSGHLLRKHRHKSPHLDAQFI